MGAMGVLDESLGLPSGMTDSLRRRGVFSRLANLNPEEEDAGAGPLTGSQPQPRLAQLMKQVGGGTADDASINARQDAFESWRHPKGDVSAPADFPEMALPDTNHVRPQLDTEPPPATRLSDGAAFTHPNFSGQTPLDTSDPPMNRMGAPAMREVGTEPRLVDRISDDSPSRNMAAGDAGTADMESRITGPQRLADKVRVPDTGAGMPDAVTAASARLQDAMKPHGIDALHATASNPFVRGLEKFGIGALKGLDIAGTLFAPNAMASVPGTRLNELVNRHARQGEFNTAVEDDLKEAQAGNFRSEAEARRVQPDLEQTAAGRRELAGQYGLTGEDRIRYILTGQMPVAADKPNLSEQAGSRAQVADQYGLQGADRQHYILTGQLPTDKPDTSAQDDARMEGIKAKQLRGESLTPQEAADLRAYSWRKTLGPQASSGAADARQTRQQQFEIDKEARGQINAAEKQYRQAKESADALGDFVNLASQGNKIAGAAVPLEGTLEIVTSQGVKRINRTEVEGIEGAGSLFDRIQSKVGKWVKGQPMPSDLLTDFKELNDSLRQNSYRAYSDAYDQAKDTYSAYGTDFRKIKKLPPPQQTLKDHMKQSGPASGMIRFRDSQGGVHDIPRGNLGRARQRDPGLTVVGN